MTIALFVSFVEVAMAVDPPAGGLSPLAWTLILALATTLVTVTGALWKDRSQLYKDVKACNMEKAELEEEVIGLLKVLRIQLEQSKGGRPR